MIIEEHIKEGLSKAYIMAVAHTAGLNCKLDFEHDYGIDGCLRNVIIRNSRRVESGHNLDFQLKSTQKISKCKDNNFFAYDLEAKNYNDLIDIEVATPRILILFVLANKKTDWLNITEANTRLKKCAWWISLKGRPISDNKSKVRIKIPKNQILTVNELNVLMSKVKRGEPL